MEWTTEKVASLAPDSGTENRGKKLATTSKWSLHASDGRAVWGECKGSGSEPYYVKIDLMGPAYGCSCPVKKLPCKHIMGLFFLLAQQSNFPVKDPPNWVSDWIAKRDAKSKKETAPATPKTEEELLKSQKAKEKRTLDRMSLMETGVDELEQWLLDLFRQGFANVDINNSSFWEQAAFKMKDAKLSRVSYFMKETGEIASKSANWTEELTARVGELYLLVKAFRNIDKLPELTQEEVFNTLGRTVKKSEVIEQGLAIKDKWLVLAKKEEVDLEGIQVRRVWLQGFESGQEALILDYAFGNLGFEQQYVVGAVLDGELAYYPAAFPQRAILSNAALINFSVTQLPIVSESISHFQNNFVAVLAENPWVLQVPIVLTDVRPFKDEFDNYFLLDKDHKILPLANLRARVIWRMLAMSGGHPVTVIGEWNGASFEALSLWKDNKIEEL
jgi:hypothetical protein